jgi:hypothetical protein
VFESLDLRSRYFFFFFGVEGKKEKKKEGCVGRRMW